jgi:hypothetical protein
MCSGIVSSSCPTSGIRRNLAKDPVINHEWRKDREDLTSGTYIFFVSVVICDTDIP